MHLHEGEVISLELVMLVILGLRQGLWKGRTPGCFQVEQGQLLAPTSHSGSLGCLHLLAGPVDQMKKPVSWQDLRCAAATGQTDKGHRLTLTAGPGPVCCPHSDAWVIAGHLADGS